MNAYAEYVRATYNNSVSTFLSVPWFPSIGGYGSVDGRNVPAGQVPGFTPPPVSGGSNDSYMAAVVLQEDVLDFGRRSSGVAQAEAGIDLARSDALVAADAVVFQVRKAYYDLLASLAFETTAEKTLAEAKEHFTWAHEAVKDGLRPPVDEVQAKADVTKGELALVRAQAGVRVSRVRLIEAIGEVGIHHIQVQPTTVPPDIVESEDALLDLAYRQRPDYAALRAQQREAAAGVARIRAEFYPRLWAQGSVEIMGADPNLPTSLSVVPDWDLGLVLAVPIFEGFLTTHQAREAEAKTEIVKDREADLRLTIIEQVREAYVNFKSALEAVTAADANRLAAEEELHVVAGRYNNGLGNILDLVISQAIQVTAEDEAVRERYQAGVARSVLDLAIGAPPPVAAATPIAPAKEKP